MNLPVTLNDRSPVVNIILRHVFVAGSWGGWLDAAPTGFWGGRRRLFRSSLPVQEEGKDWDELEAEASDDLGGQRHRRVGGRRGREPTEP